MRWSSYALAVAAAALVSQTAVAQGGMNMDASRSVAGGGIKAAGWMGKADGSANVNDAKFEEQGSTFHIVTGPAATYWNPKNTASGDYTVSATFTEPQFMNLNSHAHPYGIMIAGNGLGTANESLLYCEAYGDGRFIVRGFGPRPFQMNGREGGENAAIHKAAGKGQPVTQMIAMSVKGDQVSCAINGTVVGTYSKADLVGPGKLTSLDGVYGLRSAHNTEVNVTDFKMTKP